MELVGEKVLYVKGPFRRVRRWFKGIHPELNGRIHKGLTGWETVVEQEVCRPSHRFSVSPKPLAEEIVDQLQEFIGIDEREMALGEVKELLQKKGL